MIKAFHLEDAGAIWIGGELPGRQLMKKLSKSRTCLSVSRKELAGFILEMWQTEDDRNYHLFIWMDL